MGVNLIVRIVYSIYHELMIHAPVGSMNSNCAVWHQVGDFGLQEVMENVSPVDIAARVLVDHEHRSSHFSKVSGRKKDRTHFLSYRIFTTEMR